MDISSVGGSAMTPEVQAQYAVKCMSLSQQTSYIAGDLIQDTAEISPSLYPALYVFCSL